MWWWWWWVVGSGRRAGVGDGRELGGCKARIAQRCGMHMPCREPRTACHVPVRSHVARQGTAGLLQLTGAMYGSPAAGGAVTHMYARDGWGVRAAALG